MSCRPFVVLAEARSGSTSLAKILDLHPDIGCVNEPFNPELPVGPKPPFQTHDQLALALDALYEEASGFKHVWNCDGSPFSAPSFNEFLITHRSPKIVFMFRRNLLQRFISLKISEQSSVWQPMTAALGRREVYSRTFKPIDAAEVEHYLRDEQGRLANLRHFFNEFGVDVFELAYEDLYGSRLSVDDKLNKISGLLEFLNACPFAVDELRVVRSILNPKTSKLNDEVTYELIPNAWAIDSQFRSDTNGYLFVEPNRSLTRRIKGWLRFHAVQANRKLAAPKRIVKRILARDVFPTNRLQPAQSRRTERMGLQQQN